MKRLNETSEVTKLKKTLYGVKNNVFTFCIATPENPMAEALTDEENMKRREEFESYLRRHRVHFHRVKGKYGNEENSYVMANINLDLCKYLFGPKKYNQESFIFGVSDPSAQRTTFYYYQQEGDGKFNLMDSETKVKDEALSEDFFTSFRNFKFSIPFSIFSESIDSLSEELERDYGWNPDYRDNLEYVSMVEGKTLKHLWEYSCTHLLTEQQEEERRKRLKEGTDYYREWVKSVRKASIKGE